jgi:phospholipid transport system substrate-binding protein
MSPAYFTRGIFALFIVMALVLPAFAAGPKEGIKQTTDKIISLVSDPALKAPSKTAEKEKLIRQAVDERFNWEEMARRSLATQWTKRTDAEKKEFTRLFSDLLERTYMKKVEDYSGEKVLYEGETQDGDYATVKVKIVTQKNKDIPVEYRLKKEGNNWLIYDISIEGVSLVNNYRTQFNSILLQSSYENLVKKLKEKVEPK